MTAYSAISDGDIDPESPITATFLTKMRDNPIATAEGASGAPKNQTASLEQAGGAEAVTSDCLRDGAVQTKISESTAGGVGTHAFLLRLVLNSSISFGSTYAGSELRSSGVSVTIATLVPIGVVSGGPMSGTWRAVGHVPAAANSYPSTLFLRIS